MNAFELKGQDFHLMLKPHGWVQGHLRV